MALAILLVIIVALGALMIWSGNSTTPQAGVTDNESQWDDTPCRHDTDSD